MLDQVHEFFGIVPADDLDIPDLTDLISAVMEEAGENPPT